MQTNVWLTLKWNDCQFSWTPGDYGGLESMRVPQERVWTPDIVLFNKYYKKNFFFNFKNIIAQMGIMKCLIIAMSLLIIKGTSRGYHQQFTKALVE